VAGSIILGDSRLGSEKFEDVAAIARSQLVKHRQLFQNHWTSAALSSGE
jgi:hypothetical protein